MADTPVVCQLVPRQCGKTTLAKSAEKDRAYITLDEASYHRTATEDPDGFVDRLPARVTLDEVQRAPGLLPGGYPEPLTRSPARVRQWHRQYLNSIIERDVQDIAPVKDGRALGRLLEILALRTASLLNVNSLSKELGLHRGTVDQYISILERLFLIRSLPGWHRQLAKRRVKAPKIYLVDSGLAATLADLSAGDWLSRRELVGHLLESFVVQQIHAQAVWTDPDLRFWHYRDKDQAEVDRVITRGEKVWGGEIKASHSVDRHDGKGLDRLADQCGGDFQGGCVLYDGRDVLPIGGSRHPALTLRKLWEL